VNKYLLLTLSLIAVLMISCGGDDNPAGPSGQACNICPIELNHGWASKMTLFTSTGNIFDESDLTQVIVGDTVIQSVPWYVIEVRIDGVLDETIYLANKTNGVYQRVQTYPGHYESFLVYKRQVSEGTSYPLATYGTVSVLSKDTSVTVPAGTFDCYLYHLDLLSVAGYESYDYLAPDVGFIKTERFVHPQDGDPYRSSLIELDSLIGQ